MAKLTRANSLSALGEAGDPPFSAGPGRISIGLTSKVTGTSYHLHLSEAEAQRLAAFIVERIEINALQSLR